MDANKVISFVLGLVVVIVFLAVISGRINLGSRFLPLSRRTTPTPTPTITVADMNDSGSASNNNYQTNKPVVTPTGYRVSNGKTATNIPNTGAPTLLLPLAFSALGGGIFLKKKS